MAWNAKVIDIFLSSPSDVSRERALVRKTIDEWNQRRGTDAGCIFSVLGWESVTAEIEDYAQGSINDQIGDTYDVMLGLMWMRFGTPTGKEDSGTFEEFKRALERKRSGDAIRISFYFKQAAPIDLGQVDPSQLAKVRQFNQFIRDEGGLTSDFSDEETLRRSIELLLERIAKEKDKYPLTSGETKRSVEAATSLSTVATAPGGPDSSNDDQIGVLDLIERLGDLAAQFEAEMLDWANNVNSLGETATIATAEMEELAQFGTPDPAEVRKVIDRVTSEFNRSAEFIEERSPKLTGQLAEYSSLISSQFRLMPDFSVDAAVKAKWIKDTSNLLEAMQFAYDNSKEMVESIAGLPRMSMAFNVARQRLIRAYEPFLRELALSRRAVEDALIALKSAYPEDAELAPPPKKPPTTNQPKRRQKRRGPRRRR